MNRQALIIGLGQFGMTLARTLAQRGVEVLAVDVDEERVRKAAGFVEEALCFDATDEDALSRTLPGRRDVVVCAIGDEAREASIICTALLRQMGAKRIVARSGDPLHARILQLVGASEVVDPEREFGERYASRLLHATVLGELSLGEGLVISEVKVPEALVGRNLVDLRLRQRFGITVVAVRGPGDGKVSLPEPETPLRQGDAIVIIGGEGCLEQLLERV